MTPEKALQNEIIKYLKDRKVFHYRTQMGMKSGMPDIIAIYCGVFVGIEIKRPDGKGVATEQQVKMLNDIREAGGVAGIVENILDLKLLLGAAYEPGKGFN